MNPALWTQEKARKAFSENPNIFESLPPGMTDEPIRIEWASLDGRHLAGMPAFMRSADVCLAAVRSCSDSWEFLPPDMQADPSMREELRQTLERELALNPFARFGPKGAMLKELDRQDQASGLKPAGDPDEDGTQRPGQSRKSLLSAAVPACLAGAALAVLAGKNAAPQAEEHLPEGPRS